MIVAGDLTPDASELYWYALDGRVQVCGPDDVGGWSRGNCNQIGGVDQIAQWFWDDESRERDLAVLDLQPDDRVESCWPDGRFREAIHRSLVADGVLYTVSASMLQANDLTSLDLVGHVELR